MRQVHNNTRLFSLIFATSLGMLSTIAFAEVTPTVFANRDLCSPQSADMSKTTSFTTTCDWGKLQPGADTNPQITLSGKQTVHADCEFTGPDNVQLIIGKKHAGMKPVSNPGSKFNFTVQYEEDNSGDDNQNILIYLNNTSNPSKEDKLVCTFIPVAQPSSK